MPLSGCALTTDYSFGCGTYAGGNVTFWIIEKDNVTAINDSSGLVTGITRVAGKVFRKYQLVLATSSTKETITGNRQNGTLFYAQTAVMIINKQQIAVRNEILFMSRTNLILISQDTGGAYRLYGRDNGLTLLTGDIDSGTAWTDRNGYTLNFTGDEFEPAPFVDPSVIATLQT